MNALSRSRWPVWRRALWAFAAVLLLLPAAAMRVTDEVQWGPFDFVLFAGMLLLACAGFELAMRRLKKRWPRRVAGLGIVGVFFVVWAELAVGLFH